MVSLSSWQASSKRDVSKDKSSETGSRSWGISGTVVKLGILGKLKMWSEGQDISVIRWLWQEGLKVVFGGKKFICWRQIMFYVCVVSLCALAMWHLKVWPIERVIETASAFSLLKCTATRQAWTAPALLLLHSVPLLWPTSSERQRHWSWWLPQVAASAAAAAAKALWARCNNHHHKYLYLGLLVFKTKI